MKISDSRLFPYPILREGNGNFNSSKFKVNTEYKNNEIEYEFNIEVILDENNLTNLLEREEASILCHLECSKTKLRSIEELKIGKNKFKIRGDYLDGKLDLVVFIIAKKDLKDYHSLNFDSDYGKNSFFIQKGNILGIAEIPSVIIENKKENDVNLPSIFDIQIDEYGKIMKVGLDGDRIKIHLPLKQFQIRHGHNKKLHLRNIMNSMMVFPALVGVLNDLQDKESVRMYGDLRWFRVINKKLKKEGCDIEAGGLDDARIFSIAQKISGELFSDAMDSLNYLGESEE